MNNVAIAMAVRLVHIVSGVLWVGAATMLAAYVLPAARAALVAAAVATLVAAPAIHRALELAEKREVPGNEPGGEDRAAASASLKRYANAMWLVVVLLVGTASMMAISRFF